MEAEEIRHLPVGTRVRGSLGEGTITQSIRYGKGLRLDKWNYHSEDDIHGFSGLSDRMTEEFVSEVVS